jgi:hypothetical protein
MKTKLVLFAPVALVALTFLTGHASAAAVTHHGGFCTPRTPASAANLHNHQFGPTGDPSAGVVTCPAFVVNGPNANVNIGAYDRNSNQISGGAISCTVLFLSAGGVVQRSFVLATTGASPLIQTPSTGAQSTSGTVAIDLECFIPAPDGATGNLSHLASYTIIQ